MRILWFTNDPMPAVRRRQGRRSGGSGHWMSTLLDELLRQQGIQLDVVTLAPGLPDDQFEDNGVHYFIIGQPKRPGVFFGSRQKDIEACVRVVRERTPDLIHVHGTERLYGLLPARKLVPMPAVISIQGLVSAMLPVFFGALSPWQVWWSHRLVELATRRGHLWRYREFAGAARREREILSNAQHFIGRTAWDRAHLRGLNTHAEYYHVDEMLRPVFRDYSWDIATCDRHTVIFTNSGEPLRGTEILLEAMLIVLREFPDAKLRLAGHADTRRGYGRFLRRGIVERGLAKKVDFLGYLDADTMARQLVGAHVFALSSYIENSPNSLCEAMQVGVPSVASYVGGIPSLIDPGRTGFLFPAGDAATLAEAILKIFRDDELAARVSSAARSTASQRHAPRRVLSQLLTVYERIISHGSITHRPEALSRSDAR